MQTPGRWAGAIAIGCMLGAAALAQSPPGAREQYFLAVNYSRGLGVEQDMAKALELYRAAADRGYAKAQTALGLLYDEGKGVPQDYDEALKWFRRAAEQGDPPAQFQLGYMYQVGRVVGHDRVEAWKWFSLAEARSYDDGRKYRMEIAEQMTPKQLMEAERRLRDWRPKPEPQQ